MKSIGIAAPALLLSGTVLLAGSPAAPGDTADEGRRIFAEMSRRDSGYADQQARVSMQLKRKSGTATTRSMDIAILEVPDDGTRTIVSFDSPLDVKGTKVLTYSHALREDEQWIYLPAFKRVKQIADAGKTTSFMGSEFTYEDINSLNIQLQKFAYRYLRSEDVAGTPCFVVERVPSYARSGYKKQVVWVDKDKYVAVKVDYYDARDELIKTLTLGGFKQYLASIWRADEMVMANHQNGDATLLTFSDYRFKNGLGPTDFSAAALKR